MGILKAYKALRKIKTLIKRQLKNWLKKTRNLKRLKLLGY